LGVLGLLSGIINLMLKKVVKFWLPAVIWGAIIFSGSSRTTPVVSPVYWENYAVHKIAHILEYAVLGVLLYRALIQEKISKKEAVVYAIVVCGFYGFTDEFHQTLTPTREPRITDVIIDTIGGATGVLLVWKLLPKVNPKLLNWAKKLDLL